MHVGILVKLVISVEMLFGYVSQWQNIVFVSFAVMQSIYKLLSLQYLRFPPQPTFPTSADGRFI